MTENKGNCACGGNRLIFSCSGAADVGELADRAARELTREGIGKMFCLTGVGGNVGPIVEKTRAADSRLVIDGCSVACAKKLMDNAGITDYTYLQINNLGYEKGKTPVTEESVGKVVSEAKRLYE